MAFEVELKDSESLNQLQKNYYEAQQALVKELTDAINTISPGVDSYFRISDDPLLDKRTDLRKYTKSWSADVSRVNTTTVLNDPLDSKGYGDAYKVNAGMSAADYTEKRLKSYYVGLKSLKVVDDETLKRIEERINNALVLNRINEAFAVQAFLETSIKTTIGDLKQKIANEQTDFSPEIKLQLQEFEQLNRSQIKTTKDALILHEKATVLRKKLVKEVKGKSLLTENNEKLIKQLDLLDKRYGDFCYAHPTDLTWWEKGSYLLSGVTLPIAIFSGIGSLACAVAAPFSGPAAPVLLVASAWLGKITLTALSPLILAAGNVIRNLWYGRLPKKESNMLAGVAVGGPLMMGPYFLFLAPALASAQNNIAHHIATATTAAKIEVEGGSNFFNFLNGVGSFIGGVLTFKQLRELSKKVFYKDQVSAHKGPVDINQPENKIAMIENNGPNAETTRQLWQVLSCKTAVDYPRLQDVNFKTPFYKETSNKNGEKSNDIKYSNFYAVLWSNGSSAREPMPQKVVFVASRHDKIISTNVARFFFPSDEQKELRTLLQELQKLPANDDLQVRYDKLNEIKLKIEEKFSSATSVEEKHTTIGKLYLRVNKEMGQLKSILDETQAQMKQVDNVVIFKR